MRTRTRGQLTRIDPCIELVRHTNCSQSSWVFNTNWAQGLEGSVETMTDVVVPNFSRRVSRGEVFFNPMTQTSETRTPGGGVGIKLRGTIFGCANPQWYGEWDLTGDDTSRLAGAAFAASVPDNLSAQSVLTAAEIAAMGTEASTRALAQRGMSNANLWESIAEVRQTVGMLGSSLDSANKVLSRVPARALSGVTNAYLLYRYGMRPVISDINHILTNLDAKTERVRRTARGYSSVSRFKVETRTANVASGTVAVTASTTDSLTVRAMCLDEYVSYRMAQLGFTTKGLLTLPWELIPYSFVVDYFVNVGDTIKSLVPTPSLTALGSCLVSERTLETVYSLGQHTQTSTDYICTSPPTGTYRVQARSKVRSGLASPGLVIKSDFRLDDLTRVADLAALAVQRLLHLRK